MKFQNLKILTISGLDGSGKSTQIELLKIFLEEKGKSFYYFHAVEFSIANTNRRGLTSTSSKGVTKANWFQIQLRKVALLIDICRFKRLSKKLNVDYIISDRYFYDSVININYLSGRNKKFCAEKFIPKPDLAFYIRVKPESIMQRERKPDQGMEYLVAKERIYESRLKGWNMIEINGGSSKGEVFEDIKSKIQMSNVK
jgi:thymidylate kinase